MKNLFRIRRVLIAPLILGTVLTACSRDDKQPDISEFLARSTAYAQQGQFKAAIIESRNALVAVPDSVDAVLTLADIYNDLHYHFANLQLLEPLRDHPDPRIKLALARTYTLKGKQRSAAKLLEQLPGDLPAELVREQSLLKAEIAVQQQDFSAAKILLGTLPNDADATLMLAKLEILQQRWPQARALLDPLAASGNTLAQQQLALISARSGQLEKAEELLTNLLIALPKTDILTPERATVLRDLMQVVTKQGRSNEALVYAKILADSAPQQALLEDKLRDAVENYQKGDFDKSKQLLAELHGSVANKEFTGQFLGMINFMQGDTASAEQLLSTYIDPETAGRKTLHMLAISQLNQNKPQALIELAKREPGKFNNDAILQAFYGVALLMDGQRALGMRTLQRSIGLDSKQIYAPLALARAYLLQQQKAQALNVLTSCLQQNPGEKRLQSAIVALHLQTDDAQSALRFVEAERQQQPDAINLLLLAGGIHLTLEQQEQAQGAFRKVMELEPTNADATQALAQIALRDRRWADARSHFAKLIELDVTRPAAYEGLLIAYEMDGRLEEGIGQLQQTARTSDTAHLPLAVLARQALAAGNLQNAEDYVTKAVSRNADNAYTGQTFIKVMSTVATNALANGKQDDARVAVVRALEMAPADVQLLAMLAHIEMQSGHGKEAQKIATRLQTEQPDNPLGLVIEGDIQQHGGKSDAALATHRKTWQQHKTDLVASRIINLLQAGADQSATIAFLDEWLAALPQSVPAMLRKAMHQQSTGNNGGATRLYEQIINLNPDHVVALNNLAWLYLDKADSRALPMAEKAWSLAPQDASVTDTYGWVLVQSGQTAAGIDMLEKALALKPDAADIQAHLEAARAKR